MPDVSIPGATYLQQWESRTTSFLGRLTPTLNTLLEETINEVYRQIVATSPVDTGALKRSWTSPTQRGPLRWATGTDKHYAETLEYGGYSRVGPRTVALGGGDIGEGFVAGAGIYSQQAPLGFVRKALAQATPRLRLRVRTVVPEVWKRS